MFKTFSIEPENKYNKKPSNKMLELLKHNWDYGKNEWQEPFSTQYSNNFLSKYIYNNKFDLSCKEYLIPNNSQISFKMRTDENHLNPYLTSTKKAFSIANKFTYEYNNESKQRKLKFQQSNIINKTDFQAYKEKSRTHTDFSCKFNKAISTIDKDYSIMNENNKQVWAFDKFTFNSKKHRSSSNQSISNKRFNYNPILHKFEKNSFFDKNFN